MENVQDEKNDTKNNEEEEIIDLENINDTNDNKKQYRYRRLYDNVRQKSCFDKTMTFLCIFQATLILLFVIGYLKVIFV